MMSFRCLLTTTLALVGSIITATTAFCPAPTFHSPYQVLGAGQQPGTTTALQVAIETSEIKTGMTVELDGEPFQILDFSIMKQARGAAKTTIKFRNLFRGTTIEKTFRSGEKFAETAEITRLDHQFTYSDENNYFFMNSETFEEVAVSTKIVGETSSWIEEGSAVILVFFKGKVFEVNVPNICIFQIVTTDPIVKGSTKPAVLSCGATITVPGYLEQGEMVKVDTEKKEFLERVKQEK